MVNFHDPIVQAKEFEALKWFWALVNGIFIWEFIITLDYEWSVIRGRRPYRWTIWIYSLTRVATLATVALNIYSLSVLAPINCQITVDFQFFLVYVALAASSLLIVLRIIAIWNKKTIVVAFAAGVWVVNVAFLIQGVARFRSSWEGGDALGSGCVFHLDSIRLSTVVAFVTDSILFLIMLFGLYRRRLHCRGGQMALGRLLWNQGVVYILLAVTTESMPTLFIFLNLNDNFNLMFQVPWGIAMSIAATRMYRSLSDFLSSDISQNYLPTSGRTALEINGTSTSPIFLTGHAGGRGCVSLTSSHPIPHANHFGTDITGQPDVKPRELTVGVAGDHDTKSDPEK